MCLDPLNLNAQNLQVLKAAQNHKPVWLAPYWTFSSLKAHRQLSCYFHLKSTFSNVPWQTVRPVENSQLKCRICCVTFGFAMSLSSKFFHNSKFKHLVVLFQKGLGEMRPDGTRQVFMSNAQWATKPHLSVFTSIVKNQVVDKSLKKKKKEVVDSYLIWLCIICRSVQS